MTDELTQFLDEEAADNNEDNIKTSPDTIYKKWHRSGFLTISPFFEASKVCIDIGSINPDDKKFIGHTKVYVPYFPFLTYLRAIVSDQAITLYPKNEKMGVSHIEGWVSYGGYYNDNSDPISRIFKSHYWQTGSEAAIDTHKFAFKCGHFTAKVSSTGAFIPNLSSPISAHQAQITRTEIAELALRLQSAFEIAAIAKAVHEHA